MAPSVEKKIEELELGLLHLQPEHRHPRNKPDGPPDGCRDDQEMQRRRTQTQGRRLRR